MTKDKDLPQEKKILALMIRHRNERKWWYASDFTRLDLGDLFVGYEASARLSNLASRYRWIISENDGRFIKRAIDWSVLREHLEKGLIAPDLRKFLYEQRDYGKQD